MCADPLTLAIIGTTVAAAGSGVTAMQAYSQQKYQQKVADANAKLEDAAAADAIARGKVDRQNYMREASQAAGAQRAAMAANGIEVGFGSALTMRQDTAEAVERDAMTISANSEREAAGFDRQAGNYRAQAAASGQAASGALVSGAFGVGSTLLGGAQQYKRIQWNQQHGMNPWG